MHSWNLLAGAAGKWCSRSFPASTEQLGAQSGVNFARPMKPVISVEIADEFMLEDASCQCRGRYRSLCVRCAFVDS